MTAPVGEVMTPIVRGAKGRGRLRDTSNRPSPLSFCFSRSNCASSAPTPAISICSMTIWYLDDAGKVVMRPVTMTSSPVSGWVCSRATWPFQMTPSILALSSFSVR